jgi:TetR/AcrR family fatty acid metabolism transcriptional regulator
MDSVDEQIVNAAQREFSKHGFHEAAVSDIADQAEVGKGTVYRHFGNKNELFASLISRASSQLIESIQSVIDTQNSALEKLEQIYWLHFDLFDNSRPLVQVIVNEGIDRLGDQKPDVLKRWRTYNQLVTDVMDEGIDAGTVKPGDAESMARAFLWSIWGVFRSAILFDDDNPREQYGKQMLNTKMEGLRS